MDNNEYSSDSDYITDNKTKKDTLDDDSSLDDEKTNKSLNHHNSEYREIKTLKALEKKFLPYQKGYNK